MTGSAIYGIIIILVVVLFPIWFPITMFVLDRKDKRTRCLSCDSEGLRRIGENVKAGPYDLKQRLLKGVTGYFKCPKCAKLWKKKWAAKLEEPTEEELRKMVPIR